MDQEDYMRAQQGARAMTFIMCFLLLIFLLNDGSNFIYIMFAMAFVLILAIVAHSIQSCCYSAEMRRGTPAQGVTVHDSPVIVVLGAGGVAEAVPAPANAAGSALNVSGVPLEVASPRLMHSVAMNIDGNSSCSKDPHSDGGYGHSEYIPLPEGEPTTVVHIDKLEDLEEKEEERENSNASDAEGDEPAEKENAAP